MNTAYKYHKWEKKENSHVSNGKDINDHFKGDIDDDDEGDDINNIN